jgi:hypothetical protein
MDPFWRPGNKAEVTHVVRAGVGTTKKRETPIWGFLLSVNKERQRLTGSAPSAIKDC